MSVASVRVAREPRTRRRGPPPRAVHAHNAAGAVEVGERGHGTLDRDTDARGDVAGCQSLAGTADEVLDGGRVAGKPVVHSPDGITHATAP